MWTLRTEGRLFHSGLPHKGINSIELGMEAIAYVQNKFYQDFPPVSFNIDCYHQPFVLCGNVPSPIGGKEEGRGVRERGSVGERERDSILFA